MIVMKRMQQASKKKRAIACAAGKGASRCFVIQKARGNVLQPLG
jgi:hypothetical protein